MQSRVVRSFSSLYITSSILLSKVELRIVRPNLQLAPQQLAGLNRLETWLETRSPVLWWCTSSTRWDTPSSRSRARPRPASCRGALPPEPGNTSWRERAPHHAHHSTAWPTSQLASPQPLPTTLGTRLPARQSSWRKCRPRPFDQAARRSHFRGRPSAHCAHSSTACTLAPGSHSSRRAQRSETAGGKEATTPTLVGKLLRHRPALLAFLPGLGHAHSPQSAVTASQEPQEAVAQQPIHERPRDCDCAPRRWASAP